MKLRLATLRYNQQRGEHEVSPPEAQNASQSSDAVLGADVPCLFFGDRCLRMLSEYQIMPIGGTGVIFILSEQLQIQV